MWSAIAMVLVTALGALVTWLVKRYDSKAAAELAEKQKARIEELENALIKKSARIVELETAMVKDATPEQLAVILNRVLKDRKGSSGDPGIVPTGRPPGVPGG